MQLRLKHQEVASLHEEKEKMIEELSSAVNFGIRTIKHSDSLIKTYTGLPSFALFNWLFNEVQGPATNMKYYRGENSYEDKHYQKYNRL